MKTAMEPAFDATRRSLLSRLKDWGDQASWEDFFRTYWRLIYGTALKSGLSAAEAQDVVQDTVLAVVKNIKTFRYDPKRCSFKTWLMLITKQRIIWQLRKRSPGALPHEPSPDETDRTSTINRLPDPAGLELDAIWETEWKRNLTDAALETVKRQASPKQFQIFDLYVLQNWPIRDVVRTLKVSAAQVYLAKHRVSRLLQKEIEKLADKAG